MLLTTEAIYIVTTKKKGRRRQVAAVSYGAAVLTRSENSRIPGSSKGGKVPIEIFIRGKDAEENTKQFERCLDIIKSAGVGSSTRSL